jgi:hypothetical protein
MAQWKVNEGTQVKFDGKLYAAGQSFAASKQQIDAAGLGSHVEEAAAKKPAEAKADKPVEAKAQQPGANKAQKPGANK